MTYNLSKVTNHVDWSEKLREHNKLDPWKELVTIFLERLQGVEDLSYEMVLERDIDNGEGVQLDGIGRIVLEGRGIWGDLIYKIFLKVAILANRCNGKPAAIQEIILKFVEGLSVEFTAYEEQTPMRLKIEILGDNAALAPLSNDIFRILSKCVGAGIGFLFCHSIYDEDETFRCSTTYGSTPVNDYDRGAGSNTYSLGGRITGAYLR